MKEPRKIVLILGNGFDLDLGLKTSYKDFWESEYCPRDYPAPLINHLNQRWPDNLEAVRWYDLENELLNYYQIIQNSRPIPDVITPEEKELIKAFDSTFIPYRLDKKSTGLANSLLNKGYINYNPMKQPLYSMPYREDLLSSPVLRDFKALQLIKKRLCDYLISIRGQAFKTNSTALAVLFATNCARENENFLSIYSFNYTSLPVYYGNGFRNVVHYVHGNCEKGKIIIGTRDDGEFSRSYDFLQKSFDPCFNPPALVADLLESDEVIFFGHSIGENDRQYFKAFFKQQTDYSHPQKKDITIFTKDEMSEVEIKRSIQKMTDNNLSTFYGLNRPTIIKTSSIKEDQGPIREFLKKHIADETQVMVTMKQLLDDGQ